jgi:flagellar biosynthesis chaperone FliJ
MIPRSWLILGAIIAGSTVYFYGHHVGYAERDQEMQLEIARLNDQAREKEQQLASEISSSQTKLKEANDVITKKQSSLDRLISSGRVRLNSGCVQASPGSAPASGSGDEAASESERQTLRAIAEIVAQGDRNTEQLNACIDAYNAVRSQVNGQR